MEHTAITEAQLEKLKRCSKTRVENNPRFDSERNSKAGSHTIQKLTVSHEKTWKKAQCLNYEVL